MLIEELVRDSDDIRGPSRPAPFYELVKLGKISQPSASHATITREFLVELLWPMLMQIRFDPEFYRKTYPDIAQAEMRGDISDLYSHYLNFGYFENRLPCHVEVDGSFYARTYPDIAVAILENRASSAQWHFEQIGFVEGRLPRRGWSFADLFKS